MRYSFYLSVSIIILLLTQSCTEETIYKVGITGSLTGTVYSSSNTGSSVLADATILLEGSDPLITLKSDTNGKYHVEGLRTGTYNVVISKDGYGTFRILGYSFVGGENETSIGGVTLYQLPNMLIKEASVTVTTVYYTATVAFNLSTERENSQSSNGWFRYYL